LLHVGDPFSGLTMKSPTGKSLRPDGILRDRDGVRMLAKVRSGFEAGLSPLFYLGCGGDFPMLPSYIFQQSFSRSSSLASCSGKTRHQATV
jgi:hypothetical protein